MILRFGRVEYGMRFQTAFGIGLIGMNMIGTLHRGPCNSLQQGSYCIMAS